MAMGSQATNSGETVSELKQAKFHHNRTVHQTVNPKVSWERSCGICLVLNEQIKEAEQAEQNKSEEDDEPVAQEPAVIEEIPLLSFPSPLPSDVYCTPEDFRALRPTDRAGKFRRSRLSPKEGAARITAWMQCGGDRHMLIERFGFARYKFIYGTAYTYRGALPQEVWRPGWEKQPKKGYHYGINHGVIPVFDVEPEAGAEEIPPSDTETLPTLHEWYEQRNRAVELEADLAAAQAELVRLKRPFILKRLASSVARRFRAVLRAAIHG